MAGAFTAVADDATAASWNPAGLLQLERPECSLVIRGSRETQEHESDSPGFAVGEDQFSNFALNYLSGVLPFRYVDRNWVVSMNYQEAYDFTQEFTADMTALAASPAQQQRSSGTFTETVVDEYEQTRTSRFSTETLKATVTSELTTRTTSFIEQQVCLNSLTGLDFEQEGIIDALTPALAVEITPKVAVGTQLRPTLRHALLDGHIRRSCPASNR